MPPKVTVVVAVPLHTTWLLTAFTEGVGCTVMLKVFVGPAHVTDPKVYFGVIVSVATTGSDVAFVAANDPMLPVPIPARPIEGVSLTQS